MNLKQKVESLEKRVTDLEAGHVSAKPEATSVIREYQPGAKDLLEEARNFIEHIGQGLPGVMPRPFQDILEKLNDFLDPDPADVRPFEDFDATLTMNILDLVIDCEIPWEAIVKWSREERASAERWAIQQYALASDNVLDEEIIPKPAHVRLLQESNPKRSEVDEVARKVGLLPENCPAPWIIWAERMKVSTKEWDRLHRIEAAARNARAHLREPDRDRALAEMCRVIDATQLERIQEFQGRNWRLGEKRKS